MKTQRLRMQPLVLIIWDEIDKKCLGEKQLFCNSIPFKQIKKSFATFRNFFIINFIMVEFFKYD